ncbi:hypothetical protein F1880_006698 [Penicillium rolfsii]|nr:hypothetical protein F1880_006698 [Penicillium rolfsii]
MGFITSVARCVRENRLSRRLSNAKPQRLDDDSNDLIKTISQTASVAPAESIASASTIAQHSSQEPVVPIESSTHTKQPAPWDLNIRTLFDEVDSLDPATSLAIRALSMPEYPVLRMDTIQSPFDTPTKKLDDAVDPGENGVENHGRGDKAEHLKKPRKSREEKRTKDTQTEESGRASRIKRSMTGLLKRRSLKVPQKPTSLKTLRNPNSPKWIDSSSIAEEKVVGEEDDLKWLEANELRRFDKRSSGFWTGEGIERPW